MMTSCFPIIEFIVFTLINLRSNERKFQEGVRLRSRLRVNGQKKKRAATSATLVDLKRLLN